MWIPLARSDAHPTTGFKTQLIEKIGGNTAVMEPSGGNASFAIKWLTMDPHITTVQLELVVVDRCCCGGYLSHSMASAPFYFHLRSVVVYHCLPRLFLVSLSFPLFPIPQTDTFAQWHVFLRQKKVKGRGAHLEKGETDREGDGFTKQSNDNSTESSDSAEIETEQRS